MNNSVSLMSYLQVGPPRLPISLNEGYSTENTRNTKYKADDIHDPRHWGAFNLTTIMAQYGNVLTTATIPAEPMPASPPQVITSEMSVRHRFILYLDSRVRRSLRIGFEYLDALNLLDGHTALSFGEGNLAVIYDGFTPDYAYFRERQRYGQSNRENNRAPGDIKPSWKWSMALRNGIPRQKREFKQALSQVNWYMIQHRARYGFILTDKELVAIRRLDAHGNLELSNPIPWDTQGTGTQPRLTVLLALWYIGMLASDNRNWIL